MLECIKNSIPALIALAIGFGSYAITVEQRLSRIEANQQHQESLNDSVKALTQLMYKMDKRTALIEAEVFGTRPEL
ncbi:hypothetical protein [Zooshikella sp. RANM57]|uniref:hypothetical protein n=1 Tax=Zooshikella sp. RANM57 TaxID=3425863 RepID=UPI003D6E1668